MKPKARVAQFSPSIMIGLWMYIVTAGELRIEKNDSIFHSFFLVIITHIKNILIPRQTPPKNFHQKEQTQSSESEDLHYAQMQFLVIHKLIEISAESEVQWYNKDGKKHHKHSPSKKVIKECTCQSIVHRNFILLLDKQCQIHPSQEQAMLFDQVLCLLSGHDSLTHCSPLLLFCHLGGLSFSKKTSWSLLKNTWENMFFFRAEGVLNLLSTQRKEKAQWSFYILHTFSFFSPDERDFANITLSKTVKFLCI